MNKLFAVQNSGVFVLRIEDTDPNRCVKEAFDDILNSLQWAGISADEGPLNTGKHGPYIQSERRTMYTAVAESLVRNGLAYPCFCSHDRLELLRNEQRRRGETPRYDNRCRNLPHATALSRMNSSEPHTIRFKIILKSDGMPVYHLANVVDDHFMEITHVIRGVFSLTRIRRQNVTISPDLLRICNRVHFDLMAEQAMTELTNPGNSDYKTPELVSRVRGYLESNLPGSHFTCRHDVDADRALAEKLLVLKGRITCFSDLISAESGLRFLWLKPEPGSCASKILSLIEGSSIRLDDVVLLFNECIGALSLPPSDDLTKYVRSICRRLRISQHIAMRILRLGLTEHEVGPPVGEIFRLLSSHEVISQLRATIDEIDRITRTPLCNKFDS
ncbi:hypothetical protein T265_07520 [Opisthorchis viverrini]|uniref:Glutamyl/glutaminyl-tRNA synthetase class Ib catalytic domain-containing protein n=1 Tax=Opisthorchis viverrini TaxID=6198 RepID=A0A074ZNI0_OPIVI|nr:hypothetical protein T265_07520 [Opisthorchis viverrini]KER24895.1 hypothetical protein T265_07520 [Opisthorchis viverrini]